MNYKCKKCGTELVLDGKMQVCECCSLAISAENDTTGNLKKALDQISTISREYDVDGASKNVMTIISSWDKYSVLPDFNNVWRELIIGVTGSAVAKKDKELMPVLKNHARDFDSQREGSSLLLTLLKTYPKLGTINDWEDIIQQTYGDESKFAVICDSIIYCILKGKSKSFAIEIFNLFAAKGSDWIDAGRKYIRALLSSEEIASEVFPVSSFNASCCKFAVNLRNYCKKYLEGDHKIAIEETKVWENYTVAVKARKKRNIIIASSICAVIVCIAIGVAIFLGSVNRSTIEFKVDKVIEVTFGQEPREFLDGYTVTYKLNSGKEITEPVHNLLQGYDKDKLGEQTVELVFKGARVQATVIVKKSQLSAPRVTQQGNYIVWEPVPHAEYYAVYINAAVTETQTTTNLSYDISADNSFGELNITVRAFTSDTYYEASVQSESLRVVKLEAPKNIAYANGILTWSAVEGACSYELKVNGTPYNVTEPKCTLALISGDNTVTINAKGENDNVIFGVTNQNIFYGKLNPITQMTYSGENVSWEAEDSAKSFAIYVDGVYWKDLSRSYFSVENDGFAQAFGNGVHQIGIVCKTSVMGIEASDKKEFAVAIGNLITMGDGKLSWTSLGQSATYFVTVNGTRMTLSDSYIALKDCTWRDGENTVSVSASVGGVEHICQTARVIKHVSPKISVENGILVTENKEGDSFKLDSGEWSSTIPDLSSLLAGEHTIYAVRNGKLGALEISSEQIEIKLIRAQAPTLSVVAGKINCLYDSEKYELSIFCAPVGSENYNKISSADEIAVAGDYIVRATLTPKASVFSGYKGLLSSEYSATVNAHKPSYPTVAYDKITHILSSDTPGAKFYYMQNGVEYEIIGGNTSSMPGGVFTVYARLNSTADGVLHSLNTPEHLRVSVFNLNIDMQVNALQNSNTCNATFGGCSEIDSLTFTYKFIYYDINGNEVGGMDMTAQPPITVKTKTNDGSTIWKQLTYYHQQFSTGSFNDIRSFKLIVYIQFDNEILIREATSYK